MTTKISGLSGVEFPDGDKAAAVVGPVSQVGGVPTGAIMESGSNANGSYVKYADGTMICSYQSLTSGSLAANTGREITWTYPAAFAAGSVPSVTGNSGVGTSGTNGIAAQLAIGFPQVPGNASTRVHIWNGSGSTVSAQYANLIAIGRWF
jgi:hypothetical protein